MVRVPLFFQQTFATQLFGALHDPDQEAIVEKAKASSAVKLANLLGSPGSLGGFGASDFADAIGFGVAKKRPEGPDMPEKPEKEEEGPSNKGLGASREGPSSRAKTYKVGGDKPKGSK